MGSLDSKRMKILQCTKAASLQQIGTHSMRGILLPKMSLLPPLLQHLL
jgi:hypothetical protein